MFNHTGVISDLFAAVSFSFTMGRGGNVQADVQGVRSTGLPDAVSEIFCFLGHVSVGRLSSRSRERGRLIPQRGSSNWQRS
jgi:hypothetical protein